MERKQVVVCDFHGLMSYPGMVDAVKLMGLTSRVIFWTRGQMAEEIGKELIEMGVNQKAETRKRWRFDPAGWLSGVDAGGITERISPCQVIGIDLIHYFITSVILCVFTGYISTATETVVQRYYDGDTREFLMRWLGGRDITREQRNVILSIYGHSREDSLQAFMYNLGSVLNWQRYTGRKDIYPGLFTPNKYDTVHILEDLGDLNMPPETLLDRNSAVLPQRRDGLNYQEIALRLVEGLEEMKMSRRVPFTTSILDLTRMFG